MRFLLSLTLGFIFIAQIQSADYHGPWDVKSLQAAPKYTFGESKGPIREVYYESEPLNGKPTRIFAFLGQPEKADGKLPAMVLVHGGGGIAFREWVELWVKRGYVALAMDLGGCGPDRKRLSDGMPDQSDTSKIPREPKPLKEIWTYHAVAAVIRGVSLLRDLPSVDKDKIGITGISWGGYLTCIVMGLDNRLKVAVPVYGCGFLHENSVWLPTFEKLAPEWRKEWVNNFDPSKYAGQAKMPVLFVNGSNDFAYPLDSYQKTYCLVKDRTLCITVNMPHGHQQGWAPVEIGLFVDSHLKNDEKFEKFDRDVSIIGSVASIQDSEKWHSRLKLQLHFTTDTDLPWQKRKWQTKDLRYAGMFSVGNATRTAEFPAKRPIVFFLTATDGRKATVSTEHAIIEK
jgi:cephalosporin-C deacetylase-like acetyl esterase